MDLDTTLAPENEKNNNLIMLFSVTLQPASADTMYTLQIDLVKTNDIDGVQKSQSNSFVTLTFGANEISAVKTVLIRKIVENLRMHYVCHLRVHSQPEGVKIRTESGLEGITPLEWIVPVGVLIIEGELKGYEIARHIIDISEPGVHTCYLQLRKRQFYRSKMMFPGAAFLLTSAVCFISQRYYFDNYHDMQKSGREKDSGLMEKTYGKAERFGYLGTAALILSCVSFTLSFRF